MTGPWIPGPTVIIRKVLMSLSSLLSLLMPSASFIDEQTLLRLNEMCPGNAQLLSVMSTRLNTI